MLSEWSISPDFLPKRFSPGNVSVLYLLTQKWKKKTQRDEKLEEYFFSTKLVLVIRRKTSISQSTVKQYGDDEEKDIAANLMWAWNASSLFPDFWNWVMQVHKMTITS